MKLSPETLAILKNFASINESILFRQGNKIRTMKYPAKTILGEAVVPETFPKEFAIYNLNQFLNGYSLLDNPELDFSDEEDRFVILKEGKRKIKYFFCNPEMINSPPDKPLVLPSEDVAFNLSAEHLDKILKARSIYQLPDLSVVGDGSEISLVVHDKENPSSNEYTIVVGDTGNTFTFNLRIENILILKGSYDVTISKSKISRFNNTATDLVYYLPLEPDSDFQE
ncbi:MAG: DNA polymerase [Bacteroidota bacterium]|jgi:hypothetical protein